MKSTLPTYQPVFSSRRHAHQEVKPVVKEDVKPTVKVDAHSTPARTSKYSYPHHDAPEKLKVYPYVKKSEPVIGWTPNYDYRVTEEKFNTGVGKLLPYEPAEQAYTTAVPDW